MRTHTAIALLSISSILLIMNLAGASEYAFGTKVLPLDSDVGRPLFNMPAGTVVAYWEIGVVPFYDESDIVYLSVPPANFVKANDIRLTPFGNFPAGSRVTPQDNDIGMPLTPFPGGIIRYLDLYGSPFYDLGDPVYVHQTIGANPQSAFVTITNDVRLTQVNDLMPGTKVYNFDQDQNKVFGIMPIALAPIRFFDVNGNGVYDYLDDVYLNFPTGLPAAVTVNNVRLSGPAYPPIAQ